MAYSLNERPASEAAKTHPVGTIYEPHGTIRVYAWKKPWGEWQNPKAKEGWELVLRTSQKLGADRVEKVWKENGFKTRREE